MGEGRKNNDAVEEILGLLYGAVFAFLRILHILKVVRFAQMPEER